MTPTPRERIIGFDLIRTWAFFIITCWHGSYLLFPADYGGLPTDLPGPLMEAARWVTYRSSYSGFTIVFLTSLLIGGKRSVFDRRWWLPVFMIACWVVFSYVLAKHEDASFVLWWEVYPLLLVGFLSAEALLRIPGRHTALAVLLVSVVMLCVPFWHLQSALGLSEYWTAILVGVCPDDYAVWPVLPWIALVWGGVAAGRLLRRLRETRPRDWFAIRLWEIPLVVGALAAFIAIVPHYASTPIGDEWACFAFRQPPWIFWCYFVGLLAMLRLALAPGMQDALQAFSPTRYLSTMAINRHFFLAYIVHYILFAGSGYIINLAQTRTPLRINAAWLASLVLTEMLPRIVVGMRARWADNGTEEDAEPKEA